MRVGSLALAAIVSLGASVSGVALAQDAVPADGSVGAMGTIEGSVVVVRGSETYSLANGDRVFPNDRVITRADGLATINHQDCVKELTASQSIVIDEEFCSKAAIALAGEAAAVATPEAVGGIGATPAILGLLLAGGAAAATGGGGGGTSP